MWLDGLLDDFIFLSAVVFVFYGRSNDENNLNLAIKN